MVVYADDYQIFNSLSDNVLEVLWSEASSQLRTENFAGKLLNAISYIKKVKPHKILANLSYLTYSGSLNFKESIADIFRQVFNENGITKLALVRSNDAITEFLTEKIISQMSKNSLFEYRYFDNENDAYNWLIQ